MPDRGEPLIPALRLSPLALRRPRCPYSEEGRRVQWRQIPTSAALPKFVIYRSPFGHELRKQRGTSKYLLLVPLFDLKFPHELAAGAVGTSNWRHSRALLHMILPRIHVVTISVTITTAKITISTNP